MKTIQCSRGKLAIVDDNLFDYLSQFDWRATQGGSKTWYAYRYERRNGKSVAVAMHRDVMRLNNTAAPNNIDHRDGNGLNNQRSNLRAATTAQNGQNRKPPRNNTSGFKGVTWNKVNRKWMSTITANGKRKTLGYFGSKIAAAAAYDAAARKLHGEFAWLNFPNATSLIEVDYSRACKA